MIDKDFITKILNLKEIKNIDLDATTTKINGTNISLTIHFLKHINSCELCNSNNIYIRGTKTQTIKHKDLNGSPIIIRVIKRVYKCNNCNHIFSEKIDGIKTSRGIDDTIKFEILEKLKDINYNYHMVAKELNVSDSFVLSVFDKNVSIKRRPLPTVLSIDEVYSNKLTKTKYCCILYDPISDEIIDIIDSRRKDALEEYFGNILLEERNNVKYITSDMYETYRTIAKTYFKGAVHAVDSFHVIKNLQDTLNKIRIKVMKRYEDYKYDNDFTYWVFKKFNHLLLKDRKNIHSSFEFKRRHMTLTQEALFEEILKVDKDLKEAYELKEDYRNFNKLTNSKDEAIPKFEELLDDFYKCNSEEMRNFRSTLINWKEEILNSFIRYNKWRLSNGKMENKNNEIKRYFHSSYGLSNFPRTRNRIMYSLNEKHPVLNNPRTYTNKRTGKERGHYKKRKTN